MLIEQLKNAPNSAGIYQFFDDKGLLLYVGKAKVLKNRVKSYFRFIPSLVPSPNTSARIYKMLHEVSSIEYIVVQSEHDALMLENSLIKQLKPKYNILLRDDKTYPYICIDLSHSFPRFVVTRKIITSKSIKYFGPLSSSAKELLNALYLAFPLVQKKGCDKGKKACLFYQIKRCLAPCEGKIDSASYAIIVQEALCALQDQRILLSILEAKMQIASEKLNFEEAAKIRDTLSAIKNALHVTHVELLKLENYDVFAIESTATLSVIMRLFIRNGKIVSTSHSLVHHNHGNDKDELYARTLFEFYNPMEQTFATHILVADTFKEQSTIATFLSEKFLQKISITTPLRGEKRYLTDIAHKNAKEILTQQLPHSKNSLYESLQILFDLKTPPRRIEVFDNSHFGGDSPVGAMIVWDETFDKASYRRYALHQKDEYAQMKEMLERRIADFSKESPPDLWILDGGNTLLQLAKSLLNQSSLHVDLLAIAKEKIDAKAHRAKGKAKDLIYNENQSFSLPTSDKRLHFVQRLRDEAHRFAITYHQNKKRDKDMSPELLKIEGIGPAVIKKLLSYFGTFETIYSASYEELETAVGKKIGENLFHSLKK
ncbi:MAG: excinuclease ABC subunit UvrC [Sulfurospirillaceae bacterium]|nr:excinuclease ABC subunit UvrC [Sulfurospirillaceae bacterium]MDD2827317.1 excinuclease ABC subunit UvrC [Sulfurospirillaceae bacterium]